MLATAITRNGAIRIGVATRMTHQKGNPSQAPRARRICSVAAWLARKATTRKLASDTRIGGPKRGQAAGQRPAALFKSFQRVDKPRGVVARRHFSTVAHGLDARSPQIHYNGVKLPPESV